ncbi:hypothetical protein JYJ95_20050 [Corallococcus exiguus]|uniref:ABC-three component system protein n=1 Tax=Corallococcus exiguus TaxID=83462 RepID=UPI001A8F59FD|nr:ABC-three component system protein [Corallococcus exiguus]MBN8468801.1 hypothetical protein [Corallococcus exiguus]
MGRTKKVVGKSASKKQRSNQVPGQFYGYLLQVTRSVAHLLRARQGQSVSVEHLDDVATQTEHGVVAEQDKSGLAHNPVADRSLELWKTLHNWVRAIREGALKLDTKFVLYVAQDHHGGVIDRIHAATNMAAANALVQALRMEFWGKAPEYLARAKLPSDLAEHVNGVLQASDDVLAHLFVSVTLENGSGSPTEDLALLPGMAAISADAKTDVLNYLLGWAESTINKSIEKKLPAILTWEEFQKKLVAAARKFDRSENVLAAASVEISEAEIQKELRGRTYVRQLETVKCEEDELVQAVSDFLRSAVHRTTWSEDGDVIESSFNDFEDGLGRAWKSQKAVVDIEQKMLAEEDRGRLLYAKCLQLRVPLQGMEVPTFFVPGSFHTLADSLRVGWHPRYREVIAAVFAGPAANEGDEAPVTETVPQSPPSTSPPPAATAAGRLVDKGGGA